eukprot:10964679-Lingulodinium_polyedra.AAC.1
MVALTMNSKDCASERCGGKSLGSLHEQHATSSPGGVLNVQHSVPSLLTGKKSGQSYRGASDLSAKFDECQGLEVQKNNLKAYR